jgi:acyl-CoA thioesterase FadM
LSGGSFWASDTKAAEEWRTAELSPRSWMKRWAKSAGSVKRVRSPRRLNVQYLKPVNVKEEILVEGWEVEQKGRNLFHRGEIRNAAGEVLAIGTGRFVIIGEPAKA